MSLIARRLPGILLLTCVILFSGGCKYVYGDAYTYLSVTDPSSGENLDLKIQVLPAAAGAPALPDGRYPGLIFVHGGGWNSGSRFGNGFDTEIKAASLRGFVAASIDYRLSRRDVSGDTIFPWPAQLQDLKCAVRWLKSHAQDFNLDPDHISVMGVSAGGHLAAMAAETPVHLDLEVAECPHDADSSVASAVVFSGVVDVETAWNMSGVVASQMLLLTNSSAKIATRFDTLAPSVRDSLLSIDPVTAIGSAASPVLLVHPRDDYLVPFTNAQRYFQTLVEWGRPACLLALDRGGHFSGTDGTEAYRYARIQMYEWLDRRLNRGNGGTPCDPFAQAEFLLTVPG